MELELEGKQPSCLDKRVFYGKGIPVEKFQMETWRHVRAIHGMLREVAFSGRLSSLKCLSFVCLLLHEEPAFSDQAFDSPPGPGGR